MTAPSTHSATYRSFLIPAFDFGSDAVYNPPAEFLQRALPRRKTLYPDWELCIVMILHSSYVRVILEKAIREDSRIGYLSQS